MRKFDLKGKKFGKWRVSCLSTMPRRTRDTRWECVCQCGNIAHVKTSDLRNGYSTQCVECGHKPKPYSKILGPAFWKRIKNGASKRKIPFQISRVTAEQLFISQQGKCNLSGLDICLPRYDTDVRDKKVTASLDRIDNNKPYTINNVQWVHKDINRMKNIHHTEYFLELCRAISAKYPKKEFEV